MKSIVSAVALAAATLCAAAPASAATVTFQPASSHINLGDSVNVSVFISDLGAEVLSGVDINFMFSSGAATRSAHDFSSLVAALDQGTPGNADYFEDVDVPGGELGIQAYSFLDDADLLGQADSFLLGSFTMFGSADGVTTISFGADPDFERLFVGLNFGTLDMTLGTACIGVGTGDCNNVVPEPGSYGLVALALLAAGAATRRRRLQSAT